jgi:hypothetical protein
MPSLTPYIEQVQGPFPGSWRRGREDVANRGRVEKFVLKFFCTTTSTSHTSTETAEGWELEGLFKALF